MGLLGRWFVKVEVDKAGVKADLAATRREVVAEAKRTRAEVANIRRFSAGTLGGLNVDAIRNRGQAIRAAAQLKMEQRALEVQSIATAASTARLGAAFATLPTRINPAILSITRLTGVTTPLTAAFARFGPVAIGGLAAFKLWSSALKAMDTGEGQVIAEIAGNIADKINGITSAIARFNRENKTEFFDTLNALGAPRDFGPLVLPNTRHAVPGLHLPSGPGAAWEAWAGQQEKDIRDENAGRRAQAFGDRTLALDLEAAQLKKNAAAVRDLTLAQIDRQRVELAGLGFTPLEIQYLADRMKATAELRFETDRLTEALERGRQEWVARAEGARMAQDVADIKADRAESLAANTSFLDSMLGSITSATHGAVVHAWGDQSNIFEQLAEEYRKNATTMVDVYRSATMSVEGLFSDVLYAGITGNLDQIDDAFKSFLKNLAAQISNFLAQRAVMALFGAALGGGGLPAQNQFAANWNLGPRMANGGILAGGFRAFASGGIVNQPTLGLVGEGRYNEAVVPLPDGKSIPVEMKGAESVINQTIVMVSDPREYRTGHDEIVTIVSSDILRGGPIHNAIRRRTR